MEISPLLISRLIRQGLCFAVLFSLLTPRILAQEPCLTETIRQRNALRFPELAGAQTEINPSVVVSRSAVTIPVVVHVLYRTSDENISDEQIFSQMEVLNEDFRLLNANAGTVPTLFASLAADVEFNFCLASTDPQGQASTGITRQSTTWNNIGQATAPDGRPRIHYSSLGGQDAWAPEHYLNIWVGAIGGGILGYATTPGSVIPAEDGVVVDPRYFGRTGLAALNAPHDLGRTATHEVGHYFNLRHIWGENTNSCFDDDDVTDTPVQRAATLGCPVFPQLSCGNPAMFMNYMDYTDDACMSMFSTGQKTRMWAALTGSRPSLLESTACLSTPVETAPERSLLLEIRPNPASSRLTLQLPEGLRNPEEIRLLDAKGRCWWHQDLRGNAVESLEIPVDQLPAGMYVLGLRTPAGMVRGRFVKLR
ncbi:MAG: hypothetical protein IT260_03510 [Saprospiraceae bacterium]|nr:hypothetical protein [Saprospiraceae bacterium]